MRLTILRLNLFVFFSSMSIDYIYSSLFYNDTILLFIFTWKIDEKGARENLIFQNKKTS